MSKVYVTARISVPITIVVDVELIVRDESNIEQAINDYLKNSDDGVTVEIMETNSDWESHPELAVSALGEGSGKLLSFEVTDSK